MKFMYFLKEILDNSPSRVKADLLSWIFFLREILKFELT